MKKVLVGLLLLVLFMMGMTGCSKDDDDDEKSANLKALSVSVGELTPSFSKDVTAYTVNVPTATTTVTVTATAESSKATVSGAGEVTLTGDETIVTIVVKAEDQEVTKAYTITIKKDGGAVIPANTLRVHYLREDGEYENKVIWAWNDTTFTGTWPEGIEAAGTDDYGVYYHIPLAEGAKTIGFLVVDKATEIKDGGDKTFDGLDTQNEIWIMQGSDNVFTAKPDLSFFEKAEFTSKTNLVCTSKTDVAETAEIVVYKNGEVVPSTEYTINKNGKTATIVFNVEQDITQVYSVSLNGKNTAGTVGSALLNSTEMAYLGDDLGATLNADGTVTLKLWSPIASKVEVILFDKADQTKAIETAANLLLTKTENNVWTLTLNEANTAIADLEGYFYQYKVTNYGVEKVVLDPYAKSMAAFDYFGVSNGGDNVGKGAFVDLKKAGPAVTAIGMSNLHDKVKGMDMIAYEVHTRDFTIGTDVEHAGTFAGFKNYTAGLDHLQDLGITHVQFLPLHNFYTVDEMNKNYTTGEDANGFETNYNWGYDPHNYFTLEGWYSTNAADPYARVKEFKELVNELHNRNIGVIVDVVYNHTYKFSILNDVVPGVYHRPAGKAVPVGDPAVATENPMVRKMVVDSIKLYVEEYGVDGFRFDLMGFIDIETMRAIREAVGPNIILHGEAWDFTDLSADMKTVKGTYNYPHELNIAAFNDTTRDSYRGSKESSGFVTGNGADILKVKAGITGNITGFDNGGKYAALKADKYDYDLFCKDTLETNLQFLTVHDGFTLWDKINVAVPAVEGTTYEEKVAKKVAAFKQATAMLMTSQGKIIVQGGMEIARTKPLASLKDSEPHRVNHNDANVVVDTDVEPVNNKFHENSYRSVDYTNKFRWERKERAPYKGIYDYTKGLMEIKRSIPAFRMTDANAIRTNLQFIGEKEEVAQTADYKSWAEVPELTVVFKGINMADVTDNTLYVAGELAAAVETVTVNAEGSFQISLTKEDIAKIDLGAWGNPDAIDWKFQTVSGDWVLTYPQDGNVSIDYTTIGLKNLMLAEFANTTRAITIKAVNNHISFDTVPTLTVKFINAPEDVRGKTVWMMGEVYPASTVMPMENGTKPTAEEIAAYYGADSNWAKGIAIDANGSGEFVFSKNDINNLNLGAWGNGGDIDFALISEAGVDQKWSSSYSDMGKNVIKASNIENDNTITIDLSIIDHIPGESGGQLWVAYTLKDGIKEYIVVHNAGETAAVIEDEVVAGSLANNDWKIILDSDEANVNGVATVDAGIDLIDGKITVPAQTSVIFEK